MDTSPVDHFAASTGNDGTVRCLDYVDRKTTFTERFSAPGNCLAFAPTKVDPDGRTIAVGFNDGVVRVLLRQATRWARSHVFKPHKSAVRVPPANNLLKFKCILKCPNCSQY
jgi:WD40 repeat protein